MGMRNDTQKVAATLCGNEDVPVRRRVDRHAITGSRTMPVGGSPAGESPWYSRQVTKHFLYLQLAPLAK
jgi:hypothetical protein